MFESINAAMKDRGFTSELDSLVTDEDNLIHLVLHEIAGHVLSTGEQIPRDRWAFAELAELPWRQPIRAR